MVILVHWCIFNNKNCLYDNSLFVNLKLWSIFSNLLNCVFDVIHFFLIWIEIFLFQNILIIIIEIDFFSGNKTMNFVRTNIVKKILQPKNQMHGIDYMSNS